LACQFNTENVNGTAGRAETQAVKTQKR